MPLTYPAGRRRIAMLLAVSTIFGLLAALSASAEAATEPNEITVMTRNVYLGADLAPALNAPDLQGAINGAGEIVNEVDRTDFPARSKPLAKEIKKAKPDLVGLQEVALWRQQVPSDLGWSETGGLGAPATDVKYDFLKLLMKKLKRGYDVVAVQKEFDAELPANTDGDESTGPLGADLDGRLTMRDVILVRKDSEVKLKEKSIEMAHYINRYEAQIGGETGPVIPADRGWLSVDGSKGTGEQKVKFRFVNTHLEAFGEPTIREAQAKELIKAPLHTKMQVILVGDLNSGLKKPHKINGDDQLAFEALDAFGMTDVGAVQSCCYPSALDKPKFEFDHTVDHVLVKPRLKRIDAYVTGNDPDKMTPSGLWPSDHGGVVSTLLLAK